MIPERFLLKNTVKHPTSVLIGALDKLGLEIIESLLEQGGYVIVVDTYSQENISKLEQFPKTSLISFLDYSSITFLEEEIRRLDYVFYFSHQSRDVLNQISSQQFLAFSNYLDTALSLAVKFDAKFLLTTSIKAHQMALANQEVGLNYGLGNSATHTIYTDMEVQRYAESLTIEYYTKKKLDARICRLGEIIGDGMDFLAVSSFVDMVLMASQNHPIVLKKDGLETEYYIHILDAAYGLIKAQFSQNTSGKIFSVVYEHAFTHLSLAYKIQEVHPDCKEIQFADEKDNLPSIRLYKPAPNLQTIGWITRVPIEKAIKQSIAATKIFLLESDQNLSSDKSKSTKLQKFISLAKRDDSKILTDNDIEGPITKLIKERKKQEELRKSQLNLANSQIKSHKKKKVYTPRERWTNITWELLLWLSKRFNFFKNKTPSQLGFLTVIFVVFILSYLFIISPFIAIGRNIMILNSAVDEILIKAENQDFFNLEPQLQTIDFALSDLEFLSSRVGWVFPLLGLGENFEETKTFISGSKDFLDGVNALNEILVPLNVFSTRFDNNLQIRSGTDSYLVATSSGVNLSPILETLNSKTSFFEVAKKSFENGITLMQRVNYSKAFDGNRLQRIYTKLASTYTQQFQYFDFSYLESLLGTDREKTYAFLILDNARPRPMGGDLASIGLISFRNGSITDILIKATNDVSVDLSDLNSQDLNAINQTKFTYKNLGDVSAVDLMNIILEDEFKDISYRVFEKTFAKKIDAIFTVQLSALILLANNENISVEINSIPISDISSITTAQDTNNSLISRRRVISEYSSRVFFTLINKVTESDFGFINSLRSGVDRGSIKSYGLPSDTASVLGFTPSTQNFNSFLSIYLSADDPLFSSPERVPSVTTSLTSELNNAFIEINQLNLRLPSLGTTHEVAICMPSSAPSSSINIFDFPIQRHTINTYRDTKCSVFKIVAESDIRYSYTLENFVNQRDSVYDFSTLFTRVPGVNHNADFNLKLSSSFKILSTTPNFDISANNILFTEILNNDKIIRYVLRKQ